MFGILIKGPSYEIHKSWLKSLTSFRRQVQDYVSNWIFVRLRSFDLRVMEKNFLGVVLFGHWEADVGD